MPKKEKTRRKPAKRAIRRAGKKTKIKPKKREEESQIIFDSTKPSTDSLFSAGVDAVKENVITFADFKNENLEKLENSLKEFGFKFCDEKSIGMSEIPKTPRGRGWFRNLFGSMLIGLVFAVLFSAMVYVFALPIFQDAKVSILKNSEVLKAGLPSSRVQTFTANLFVPMDNLLNKLFPK